MLSVYTRAQIAIAVLHDLSSSKVLNRSNSSFKTKNGKIYLISWKK